MSESDTYSLLGVLPIDYQASEKVVAIAYLKKNGTTEVLKHEIATEATWLPKLLEYPSEYLTSRYLFYSEEEALETADTYPDETFLISFHKRLPNTKNKLTEVTLFASAIPVGHLRNVKKRVIDMYKSTKNIVLNDEDDKLYNEVMIQTNR